MKIKTLAVRILNQLRHDKRTVALVVFAPLLILTLIYFILGSDNTTYKFGVIQAPDHFLRELRNTQDADVELIRVGRADYKAAISSEDMIAAVAVSDDLKTVKIYMDGTDAQKSQKAEMLIHSAAAAAMQEDLKKQAEMAKKNTAQLKESLERLKAAIPAETLPDAELSTDLPDFAEPEFYMDYVYGSEDSTFFDHFGAPLIGLIVFFFVFLIAGINFLGERTSKTLEKMLSTPIRRGEIIAGYVLGFSALALIQTSFVTVFVVYVLGLTVVGSIWYVLLVNLLTAVTALTLGILMSTLANSEFQMIQFVPLVILPQVFLCGIFELSGGWKIAGSFMPLTYTTDALKNVMLRGDGFSGIWTDCAVLAGCSVLFMLINIRLLRRERKI